MSSYTSYSIDKTTRYLIIDKDGNERVITDLGGNHDLIKIYIDLALKIWKPEEIGFSDLIEKEKDKGFTSWEFFLKQAIKNAA
jgi:hypothetical protein